MPKTRKQNTKKPNQPRKVNWDFCINVQKEAREQGLQEDEQVSRDKAQITPSSF